MLKIFRCRVVNYCRWKEKLAVKNQHKKLTIGIPREEERNENRVALTPLNVELLVKQWSRSDCSDKRWKSCQLSG